MTRPPRIIALAPLALVGCATLPAANSSLSNQPPLVSRAVPIVSVEGLTFRDLDRNGKLTPYEDWRLSPQQRADDLVGHMTQREKAGTMLHAVAPGQGGAGANGGGSTIGYNLELARRMIVERGVNSMLTRITVMPEKLAEQNNALQEIAEGTRLAIPMTISTDPRSSFGAQDGASTRNMGFSQWPSSLGFGALADPALMQRFSEVVASEYRATGITMALSPQADIASDPRWGRFSGTFGGDPATVAALTRAYVVGFQGGNGGMTRNGVLAVVKHWVGYGAQIDGLDSHNYYGRFGGVRSDSLALHLRPFEEAFAVHVGGVMPTYSIASELELDGKRVEQVGAAFSREILGDLLRGRYRYDGLVVSDWRVTRDCGVQCRDGAKPGEKIDDAAYGMPWGVGDLTVPQRFAKAIAAGVDSFGGVDDTDELLRAFEEGRLPAARIDEAVRRILVPKFEQGLFENPYVDPAHARDFVGNARFVAEGERAQSRAGVLLKNEGAALPLTNRVRKVWAHNIAPAALRAAGFEPVAEPAEADVAIIRTTTPWEDQHPNYQFKGIHHEGDLDYKPGHPDREAVERAAAAGKPVVLAVMLDRPAILTDLAPLSRAIVANFGISDAQLLATLRNPASLQGKLPFALPRSMASVRSQRSDVPNDEADPLFPVGFALDR